MKKIKLGRTALLVLGIGGGIMIVATLLVIYMGQSSEHGELERNLAGAQLQLTKLIAGNAALEDELASQQHHLAQTQSALGKAKASFPDLEASIEYDEVLAGIAAGYDLEVLSMAASEPREEKVEDITFSVITFEVEVRGDVGDMVSMLSEIARDERFISASVEVVTIDVPEAEEEEEPTAKIELAGYSYGGG